MKLKVGRLALIATLVFGLSASAFASKKDGSKHVAVGTIASIDANQVVVNEKLKGKEQAMTYMLDSSTQKSGNLAAGSLVTVQYRSENNQNIATAVRERAQDPTEKTSKKANKS